VGIWHRRPSLPQSILSVRMRCTARSLQIKTAQGADRPLSAAGHGQQDPNTQAQPTLTSRGPSVTLKVVGNGSENSIRLTGLSIHRTESSGSSSPQRADRRRSRLSLFDQLVHRNSPAAQA